MRDPQLQVIRSSRHVCVASHLIRMKLYWPAWFKLGWFITSAVIDPSTSTNLLTNFQISDQFHRKIQWITYWSWLTQDGSITCVFYWKHQEVEKKQSILDWMACTGEIRQRKRWWFGAAAASVRHLEAPCWAANVCAVFYNSKGQIGAWWKSLFTIPLWWVALLGPLLLSYWAVKQLDLVIVRNWEYCALKEGYKVMPVTTRREQH